MNILFFQIAIYLIIIIASKYSRSSRNTAIILISVFTLFAVFTTGLMIIQFLTIYLAYNKSNSILEKKEKKAYEKELYKYMTKEQIERHIKYRL